RTLPDSYLRSATRYGGAKPVGQPLTIDPSAFGATREEVRLALEAANIEARPVWKPMHSQPLFAGCEAVGGHVAESLFQDGLCLPSGSNLSADDLDRVVAVVRGCHRMESVAV